VRLDAPRDDRVRTPLMAFPRALLDVLGHLHAHGRPVNPGEVLGAVPKVWFHFRRLLGLGLGRRDNGSATANARRPLDLARLLGLSKVVLVLAHALELELILDLLIGSTRQHCHMLVRLHLSGELRQQLFK